MIEYVDEQGIPEYGQLLELPELPGPESPELEQSDSDADERRAWAEALSRHMAEREAEAKQEELAGKDGRSIKIDLRISAEEKARWTAAAQTEGVSTSEFLRLAADTRAAALVS